MGKMVTSSVYVDSEKVEQITSKGFSLSQICQTALKLVVSDDFEDLSVELRLIDLTEKITKTNREIQELEYDIKRKKKLMEMLVKEQTETTTEWHKARDTVVLAKYMRSLNQITIACGYDLAMVEDMAGSQLEKIRNVNPSFNLEKHIQRFKKTMSS